MGLLDALTCSNEGFAPLLEAARRKEPSHAYLLHGPSAATVLHFAQVFARALNCENTQAPCNTCHSCRQHLNNSSEALHIVRPTGIDIRIDQIRAVIETSSFRFSQHSFKIFIICPAEAMNEQAANAFLKVLEEPTPRTIFLLVTARPDALLSTIRSRCTPLRLAFPQPRALIEKYLPKTNEQQELAWLILTLTEGSPQALRWINDLSQGTISLPSIDSEDSGSHNLWGLSFIDDEEGMKKRLMEVEPLRSNCEDLLNLFSSTVAGLSNLFNASGIEEAFDFGQRAAHGGCDRLESELPKLFKKLNSAWLKEHGEGARHPIFTEDRSVTATTRHWSFAWMETFFLCMLVALQIVTRRAYGPASPVLDALASHYPGLNTLSEFPIGALGRLTTSIEKARHHMYANVKPLRLILQNLFAGFFQQKSLITGDFLSSNIDSGSFGGALDASWMEQ